MSLYDNYKAKYLDQDSGIDEPEETAYSRYKKKHLTPGAGTPQENTERSPGLLDYAKGLGAGVVGAVGDTAAYAANLVTDGKADEVSKDLTGKTLGQWTEKGAESIAETMSPEARESSSKKWVTDEGLPGPAFSDPHSYALGFAQNVAPLAMGALPTGLAARSKYLKEIAQGASRKNAQKAAVRTAERVGVVSEGAMGGAMTGTEVKNRVLNLKEEVWLQNPEYLAKLESGSSGEQAKMEIANTLANQAAGTVGVATGLTSHWFNKFLGKMMSGQGAGRIRSGVEGLATEGGTEFVQSGVEALAANVAAHSLDKEQDIWEGVPNQAVAGTMVGGPMGAVVGAAGGGAGDAQDRADIVEGMQSKKALEGIDERPTILKRKKEQTQTDDRMAGPMKWETPTSKPRWQQPTAKDVKDTKRQESIDAAFKQKEQGLAAKKRKDLAAVEREEDRLKKRAKNIKANDLIKSFDDIAQYEENQEYRRAKLDKALIDAPDETLSDLAARLESEDKPGTRSLQAEMRVKQGERQFGDIMNNQMRDELSQAIDNRAQQVAQDLENESARVAKLAAAPLGERGDADPSVNTTGELANRLQSYQRISSILGADISKQREKTSASKTDTAAVGVPLGAKAKVGAGGTERTGAGTTGQAAGAEGRTGAPGMGGAGQRTQAGKHTAQEAADDIGGQGQQDAGSGRAVGGQEGAIERAGEAGGKAKEFGTDDKSRRDQAGRGETPSASGEGVPVGESMGQLGEKTGQGRDRKGAAVANDGKGIAGATRGTGAVGSDLKVGEPLSSQGNYEQQKKAETAQAAAPKEVAAKEVVANKEADTLIKEISSQYQPGEKDESKRGISEDTPETTLAGKTKPEVQARRQTVSNTTTGSLATGIDVVTDASDAYHIIAPIRKSAQEQMVALVLDKDGKPLQVVKHTAGLLDSSMVDSGILVGAITDIPGASSVYFAHNHPSGVAEQSPADLQITKALNNLLKGTGIKSNGMLVAGAGKTGSHYDPVSGDVTSNAISPTLSSRTMSVPLTERRITKLPKSAVDGVTSPDKAKALAKHYSQGKDGVLLLNTQHQPVSFVPMTKEEMLKLRTGKNGGAVGILREMHASNARAAIAYMQEDTAESWRAVQNVGKLISETGGARMLDAIVGGKSFAETGTKTESGGRTYFSKGDGKDSGLNAALIIYMLPKKIIAMIKSGRLEVVETSNDLKGYKFKGKKGVEGFYDPKKDKIYLVADQITAESLASVLNHELYHRAVATDPQLKKQLDGLNSRLMDRYALASVGAGTKAEQNAYKRAQDAPAEDRMEEFQAYLVSAYNKDPGTLSGAIQKWIRDLYAVLRAALIRAGAEPKNITAADLNALAQYGASKNEISLTDKDVRFAVNKPGVGVEDSNRHGLIPEYRVTVPKGIAKNTKDKLFLQATKNINAKNQIGNINKVLKKFPSAHKTTEAWSAMMTYALGSNDIPMPPYRFIQEINSNEIVDHLAKLSDGQIEDANHGFENAQKFRDGYINGDFDISVTGKLFLWGFLSRGVSPYVQESLFINAFKGVEPFFEAASRGEFNVDEYLAWADTVSPAGSGQPGSGARHNLKAHGRNFLTKMSEDSGDGRSRLQVIHDMMTDPNSTGKEIRRTFTEFGEGVGIGNKVVSFALLVAGFNDVLVIDRVQLRRLWDDGRFDGINLYDGVKEKTGINADTPDLIKTVVDRAKNKTEKQKEAEALDDLIDLLEQEDGAKEKDKVIAGTAMAGLPDGARGLLIYEALERGVEQNLSRIYKALGREGDASVGRYHWETWVAESQQEASHGTLEAILRYATGDPNAIHAVTAKEGEYGAYAYGARYGVTGDNVPYFLYTVPEGDRWVFAVDQFVSFLGDVKRSVNRVVPSKFNVGESGNAPWYNRPEVDKERLNTLAGKYAHGRVGREVSTIRRLGDGQDIANRSAADRSVTDAIERFNARERGEFLKRGIYHADWVSRVSDGKTKPYKRAGGKGADVVRGVKAVFTPLQKTRKSAEQSEMTAPVMLELEQSNESVKLFSETLSRLRDETHYGAAVYVYPSEEYADMRIFLNEDLRGGFALKSDGDIVSVFNLDNHGMVHPMLDLAVQLGGKKLDAFDTVLTELYGFSGFKEVGRDTWNEKYKPKAWDKDTFSIYNKGEPDVVRMEYDPGYNAYSEGSINIFLSDSTDSIPGIDKLRKEASAGDQEAATLLHEIAIDSLRYLTEGIKSVKIKFHRQEGLYGGGYEASLGLSVTFEEKDRAAVLGAAAHFARNFNQEQMHVVEGAQPGTKVGHVYEDGSYNTAHKRIDLKTPMSREEIESVINESGLYGISATDEYLEAYFVGDPNNEKEYQSFERKLNRAAGLIGENVRSFRSRISRLRVYGEGVGSIAYESIATAFRPGKTDRASATAGRIASRYAQREVYGAEQAETITDQQNDLQRDIAQEYEAMELNALYKPHVKRAYTDLAVETLDQFNSLPIKVEFWHGEGEPYSGANMSAEMRQDILENNHLYIYKTEPGSFGEPGVIYKDHPLLVDSGTTDINGEPMLYNDLFRAVHDYFAHGITVTGFGPKGEEAGWFTHMSMTRSPWAKWALTSETRGQNSWVNFRDEVADKPLRDRPFAPQKVDLLPPQFVKTGDPVIDANLSEIGLTELQIAAEPGASYDAEVDGSVESEGVKFSVRTKPAPEKTQKAYKLFRVKSGQLYPLFIDATIPVPAGQWLDADIGDNKKAKLAQRPGWHMGVSPSSQHIGTALKQVLDKVTGKSKRKPTQRRDDQVWAEVEYAADVDWQKEANSRGRRYAKDNPKTGAKKGDIIPGTAEIMGEIPADGYYRYKTNSNMTGTWIIAGAMKVSKVLNDAEVAQINNDLNSTPDLPRATNLDLNKLGFESDGDGIKFSTSAAMLTAPGVPTTSFDLPAKPSIWDSIQHYMQDKFASLGKVQKAIGNVAETADAYLGEVLFHGKVKKRVDDFESNLVDPLLEAIKTSGKTMEQVGEYLHARHALEANVVLRDRNPDRADNEALSGMTDDEAREILGRVGGMDEIAGIIDQMTSGRLDVLVGEDLETAQEIQKWRNTYNKYIPLHRDEVEQMMPSRGTGFHIRGKESKLRAGSTKEVNHNNIVADIVAMHEATLVRAEKNKVGMMLYELVGQNQDPNFWTADVPKTSPRMDANGEITHVEHMPSPGDADTLMLKINGEQKWITFNMNNEYAKRIAVSMKNLNAREQNKVVTGLTMLNRWLAAINTSLSPEFLLSNPLRDIQTATFTMSTTEAAGKQRAIIADVGKAYKGIRNSLYKKDMDSEWAKHFDRFEKAGGRTGWMEHYADINARRDKLIKRLEHFKGEDKTRAFFHTLGNVIENENTALENAIRLATFVHASSIDGVSDAKAARIAKELTVNFNKKGEYGVAMNAAYLFYNASIQGSVVVFKALKNPRVHKYAAATVAFAIALDTLNRAIGDDDEDGEAFYDKIDNGVKDRSLIFMIPGSGGDYFKIPLPWGFNILHVIGQEISSAAGSFAGVNPEWTTIGGAGRIFGAGLNAFNPINDGSIMQTVSPTVTDPLVKIAENKDWHGGRLKPEQSPFGRPKPEYQMHYSSSRAASKAVTKFMNDISGGDEVRPGWWDWSPEWVDLMIDTAVGAAGRVATDMVDTPAKLIGGDDIEARNIPMLRKVYATKSTHYDSNEYYDRVQDVLTLRDQLKFYSGEEAGQIRQSAGPKVGLIPTAVSSEKRLRKLRKRKRQMIAAGTNQQQVKNIEAQIKRVTTDFNTRYNLVVYGY